MKTKGSTKTPGTHSSGNTAMRNLEDQLFGKMAQGITPLAPDNSEPNRTQTSLIGGGNFKGVKQNIKMNYPDLTGEEIEEHLKLYL